MKEFTSQRMRRWIFSRWRLYKRRTQFPPMVQVSGPIPLPVSSDGWMLHRDRASRMR